MASNCNFRVCRSGERPHLSSYVKWFWNKPAFTLAKFNSLLYKTSRFHVAVRLFSNRSQKTSKCGKNISDTLGYASCATFLFLPHFDVICDLLLNRRTATWNLFVNSNVSFSSSKTPKHLLQGTHETKLLSMEITCGKSPDLVFKLYVDSTTINLVLSGWNWSSLAVVDNC